MKPPLRRFRLLLETDERGTRPGTDGEYEEAWLDGIYFDFPAGTSDDVIREALQSIIEKAKARLRFVGAQNVTETMPDEVTP